MICTYKLSIFPYALTLELYSIEMDHSWLHCNWCFKKPVKNHNIQTSKWDNDSWNANYDKLHSSLSCPFLPSITYSGIIDYRIINASGPWSVIQIYRNIYIEFSKSAPETSSSCRLYNYQGHSRSRVIISCMTAVHDI